MSIGEGQTVRSGPPDPTASDGVVPAETDAGTGDAVVVTGADVAADPADRSRTWLDGWWPFVIVAVPFAIVFLALAIRALTVDWSPVHDFALFELRVRDVGGGATPLVGPYSRFGWSHPGPILFYALAVPYRLLGSRPQGLLVGAVLLNAISVAGILLLARRRGGPWTLAGTAVAVALLLHAMGADLLISPWNPWITILPMVVLLFLAWSLALRDWVVLPAVVLVATFLVQTHVAYGVLVVAALAAASVFAVFSRNEPSTRHLRRILVISGALLAVLWLPAIIDQLGGSHNAQKVVRHFTASQPEQAAPRVAAGVVASELAPLGPWVTGPEPLEPFSGAVMPDPLLRLLVPLAGLGVAAVVTIRRHDRAGLALVVVASAASAASFVSITRINGALLPYLLRFTWAVALVVWLAVARAVAPALGAVAARLWHAKEEERRSTALAFAPIPIAAAVIVLLGVTMTGGLLGARPPDPDESFGLANIERAAVPAVARAANGGVVLVRPADTVIQFPAPNTRGLAAGLVSRLRKEGVDARVVDGDWQFPAGGAGRQLFGDARVDDGGPVAGTVTVVGAEKLDDYRPPPGSVELYRVEDRAAADEARRLQAELERDFTAAGKADAIPELRDSGAQWIVFRHPELGPHGDKINRLVTLKQSRREAVFWHPGR